MKETECKKAAQTAVVLNGISRLGLVVFLTMPIVFILVKEKNITNLEFVLVILFSISGVFLGLRAWHLYFDAQLFKNVSSTVLNLDAVDQIVFRLFKKNNSNKTLEQRIDASYKITKGFFVLLIIHLLLFIASILFLPVIL